MLLARAHFVARPDVLRAAVDRNRPDQHHGENAERLAAGAAILAVPTAIAGIYGMNFEHMPELKWQYGYPLVLGVIVAICGWLYWRFRKNGWIWY